jgi:hypothetical protein
MESLIWVLKLRRIFKVKFYVKKEHTDFDKMRRRHLNLIFSRTIYPMSTCISKYDSTVVRMLKKSNGRVNWYDVHERAMEATLKFLSEPPVIQEDENFLDKNLDFENFARTFVKQ